MPEFETQPGANCFTTGISRDSKKVDAIALNLFNDSYCLEHGDYNFFETALNENQLCAGIPSNTEFIAPYNGEHEEDYGGPLICLESGGRPIFTGVSSSNSLSTKHGQPGLISLFKNVF